MKKIIHIASDEKFINSALRQFNEVYPNQNKFFLLVDNPNKDLKYIQHKENFTLIKNELKELESLAQNKDLENVVCFHGLDFYKSYLLNKLSPKAKIIWFLWGAEVYNNPEIVNPRNLYGFHTRSTFLGSAIIKIFKNRFRQVYYNLKHRTDGPDKLIINAINRANYCAILYQEEYEFVKEKINSNLTYLKFSYYPIELMISDTKVRVSSNNILIGNSSSDTNNHLEAFKIIKELPVNDKKIIVPLSYGNHNYREKIIKKGQKTFNVNFFPLVNFMSLHQYNSFLEQCGIVIMYHYRQQAVGNVVTMLWMGAKVYLDERNTLYHYLKRIGIHVFSIQKDLHKDNPDALTLLNIDQQNQNREKLKSEISQEHLLRKLQDQLKGILNEH